MAHQVLARKYRPQRFADVAGQEHVTVTLMNALTQGRIAHGYIFSGHRGIGKTTIARILAAALNCQHAIGSEARPTAEPCNACDACLETRAGNAVDVIEIDAATNRGIDEIRELRDAARYRPARDKYKIYLLDEAHQITDAAFNALLKTLEEPPEHIVFMMATTEPENIPQTIRSRCQHFSFHAVKLADILNELRGIATHEHVRADDTALALLAEAGDGSMRDALSIMDQAIASAPVENGEPILDAAQIRELMGTVSNAVFERILEAVANNDSATVLTEAATLLDAGNGPSQLARQGVRYLRSCVIAKIAGITAEGSAADSTAAELLQISEDEQRRAARSAAHFTEEELTRFLQVMLRTFDELGYRQEQRFHFELGLLKLVHLRRLLPLEELMSRIPGARAVTPAPARTAAPVARSALPSTAPASTAAPTPAAASPFQVDADRKRFSGGSVSPVTPTSVAPPVAPKPAAVAPTPAIETASPFASPFGAPPVADAASPFAPVAKPPVPPAPVPVPEPVKSAPVVESPEPLASAETPIAPPTSTPVAEPVLAAPEPMEPSPTPAVSAFESRPEPPVEAIAPAPIASPTPTPDAPTEPAPDSPPVDERAVEFERIAVTALSMANGQDSAADALSDGEWTVDGDQIRVQMQVSKSILSIVINPEADKIIRNALKAAGHGAMKLTFLPATAETKAVAKKAKVARAGSAQARAMAHPIVQHAQQLFNAEIRNVIDLSDGE